MKDLVVCHYATGKHIHSAGPKTAAKLIGLKTAAILRTELALEQLKITGHMDYGTRVPEVRVFLEKLLKNTRRTRSVISARSQSGKYVSLYEYYALMAHGDREIKKMYRAEKEKNTSDSSKAAVTTALTFDTDVFSLLAELDAVSNVTYGLLFIMALSSLTVYSIILAG